MSIPAEKPPRRARRRIRLRGLLRIIGLLALALLIIWLEPDPLRGLHSVVTMVVLAVAGIATAVWFYRSSGIGRRGQMIGTAVGVLILAVLAGAVRLDGWDGNMRPLFAWRWMPTAEERFQTQRLERPTSQAVLPATLPPATARDYPGLLGADRRGVIKGVRLKQDWTAQSPRELWRKSIGLGWSAFAVVGEFAFTQEQRDDQEAVVCYELKTGVELWAHSEPVRFSEALGGDGPRATPTVHEGRVYAVGATGDFHCLNGATGKSIWKRQILEDAGASNRDWGMSGSPLIVGNVAVVTPGGDAGRSVWAYTLDTGEPAWHAGDDPASYASPLLTTLCGQEQILVLTAKALVSHRPTDGQLLWRHEWRPDQVIKCTQPAPLADFGYAEGKDHVLISSGYTVGSQLVLVRHQANQWNVEPLWSSRQLRAKFSNMIVQGSFVYGLDEGILTCLDLHDGVRQWKEGRYGHGQLILVGNLLLIQSESGDVVLLEISPKGPRELARLAALTDKTWNHAALAGPYLLVRNDREAACYEMPLTAEPQE